MTVGDVRHNYDDWKLRSARHGQGAQHSGQYQIINQQQVPRFSLFYILASFKNFDKNKTPH